MKKVENSSRPVYSGILNEDSTFGRAFWGLGMARLCKGGLLANKG